MDNLYEDIYRHLQEHSADILRITEITREPDMLRFECGAQGYVKRMSVEKLKLDDCTDYRIKDELGTPRMVYSKFEVFPDNQQVSRHIGSKLSSVACCSNPAHVKSTNAIISRAAQVKQVDQIIARSLPHPIAAEITRHFI